MERIRRYSALGLTLIVAILSVRAHAQAGDPATLIQEKLVSQIKLTKTTADRSDIVTAGDVVVLQKDGLMMCSSDSSYAFSNTYDNGVLTQNYKNRAKDATRSFFKSHLPFGGGGSATDAANNGCPSRKFVTGEKFWITGVSVEKHGILVSTFSDPYPDSSGNQVRYYGEISIPFPRSKVPQTDDFLKTVSELMTVAPPDNSNNGTSDQGSEPAQAAAPPAAAPAPAPAPMAAIPPPPPPPDAAPPTIALGQTIDQVTAAFGQPLREAKLGAKRIYYYKDMKVTFTGGKVSNVE